MTNTEQWFIIVDTTKHVSETELECVRCGCEFIVDTFAHTNMVHVAETDMPQCPECNTMEI